MRGNSMANWAWWPVMRAGPGGAGVGKVMPPGVVMRAVLTVSREAVKTAWLLRTPVLRVDWTGQGASRPL